MEDTALLKIAKSLIYLKDSGNYATISKGEFTQAPSLEGYIVKLSSVFNEKIYLILNTSKDFKVEKNTREIENMYFVVINLFNIAKSIEEFIKNLNKHSKILIQLFEKLITDFDIHLAPEEDPDKRGNLPYGYVIGKDGTIQVDKKEADMVRKIFMLYAKQKSMQKVAEAMKSSGFLSRQKEKIEFGVVSDILHDARYMSKDLPQSIVPVSLFKKTQEILHRSSTTSKIIKYY